MENNEIRALIESFKSYRQLLTPIQENLSDFMQTYQSTKSSIDNLSTAFSGGVKENLEAIYKNLSSQAERATDLSSRIDQFAKTTSKFSSDMNRVLDLFSNLEKRVIAINEIEKRAQEQIARLDSLLEEKSKTYNIKELQRTLDGYNNNVEKVSQFINKDVGDILTENQRKLSTISEGIFGLLDKQKNDNDLLDKLLNNYTTAVELLKTITEKQDVNESYIFDLLDKWAIERKVKTSNK